MQLILGTITINEGLFYILCAFTLIGILEFIKFLFSIITGCDNEI